MSLSCCWEPFVAHSSLLIWCHWGVFEYEQSVWGHVKASQSKSGLGYFKTFTWIFFFLCFRGGPAGVQLQGTNWFSFRIFGTLFRSWNSKVAPDHHTPTTMWVIKRTNQKDYKNRSLAIFKKRMTANVQFWFTK